MVTARSAALALLLLTVAFAGCSVISDVPDSDDPAGTATPIPVNTPTSTPTPSENPSPTPPQTATPTPNDDPTTYTTQDSNLGENEKPHGIRLVNDRNETVVAATIRITRDNADYTIEETHNLAPGGDHYGVIDYEANYTITVIVGNRNATERISASMFDCNDSTTTFSIHEDGINVRTLSTTVECVTASPE